MRVRAEYLGDTLKRFPKRSARHSGRQCAFEANGSRSTGELAAMPALDSSVDMQKFVYQNPQNITRCIKQRVDEKLMRAVSTHCRVECLPQHNLAGARPTVAYRESAADPVSGGQFRNLYRGENVLSNQDGSRRQPSLSLCVHVAPPIGSN